MKTVVITGAGTGLGKELALLFAEKGFSIILLGRTIHTLQHTATLIKQNGGQVKYAVVDVTKQHNIHNLIEEFKKEDISIVINSAGIGHFGSILEIKDEQVKEMMNVNVVGTINIIKAFLPKLLLNSSSYIINIVSTAGLKGKKNESVYCASKFAVRGLTESLKVELSNSNVKVIGAYMGGMDTPFWDEKDHLTDKSRLRSANEIADIIVQNYELGDDIIIESKK